MTTTALRCTPRSGAAATGSVVCECAGCVCLRMRRARSFSAPSTRTSSKGSLREILLLLAGKIGRVAAP
eukprot:6189180-Pleurochrysis_carterae.AAC.1